MNKQKLKFILQQGEGLGIEFKESIGSLAQEIVAFANSEGGRVFVGVNDKGEIKGVKITNKLKSQIQDIARNCDPAIDIKIKEFENILIVEVKESKNKPYKCSSGFYLRQGANSQKMTRDEILDFAVGEGKIRFDEQINKEFGFPRDFDEEKFKSFLKENNLFTGLEVKDVLVNLGLALKNGKKIFLNNAGVLFFSKDPQRFFIHAYLDCVLFKGKDKSEVIDRKIFRLGLLEQLSSAKKFVKRHLNLSYEFNDFERKETYEIPLRAIEEALVNALMHRDYFFKGANISLFIYGDRVEVVSPGGLPKGLNKKNFGKLSVRRNQIIADIFSKTPYVEQIGSGIKRMRMLAKRANLPLPKFEVNSFFIVTFKRRKLLKKPLSEGVSKGVSEGVNSLFNYIKNNPKRRVPHFEEDLGIPAKTIERWLNKLKKDGKIEFKGSPKTGGYWEVKD